ncbi:hypothetical protein [Tateyamaria sp.]|uniref:hypothetical protein n=1 Tax=Tateyamaria sp. TaxID=1929288 RepID=UPI00329DE194
MDNSDEFQLLSKSKGYLEAARVIVDTKGNKPVLRAPVAHLIAHGIEVLMKHHLLRQGVPYKGLTTKKYGHNLSVLWRHEKSVRFRQAAKAEAKNAWENAKNSHQFQDDFDKNPHSELVEQIDHLSRLHTQDTDFALRYLAEPDETAPIPLFLLDVFEPLQNRLSLTYFGKSSEI